MEHRGQEEAGKRPDEEDAAHERHIERRAPLVLVVYHGAQRVRHAAHCWPEMAVDVEPLVVQKEPRAHALFVGARLGSVSAPDECAGLLLPPVGELIVLEQLRTPCTALPELSRKTLVGAE